MCAFQTVIDLPAPAMGTDICHVCGLPITESTFYVICPDNMDPALFDMCITEFGITVVLAHKTCKEQAHPVVDVAST